MIGRVRDEDVEEEGKVEVNVDSEEEVGCHYDEPTKDVSQLQCN